MSTHSTHLRRASLAAAVLFACCALPAAARNTTFTGANGQLNHSVQRGGGNVSSQWTGSNGMSAGREVSRSASGASGTVYGPGGHSASRNVTRNSSGASATYTGPQGNQVNRTTDY